MSTSVTMGTLKRAAVIDERVTSTVRSAAPHTRNRQQAGRAGKSDADCGQQEPAAADGYGAGAKTSGAGQQNGVSTAASFERTGDDATETEHLDSPGGTSWGRSSGDSTSRCGQSRGCKTASGRRRESRGGRCQAGARWKDGATFSQTSSGWQNACAAYQAGHRCQAGGSCGQARQDRGRRTAQSVCAVSSSTTDFSYPL